MSDKLTDIPSNVLLDLEAHFDQVQEERKAEEISEYHRGYYNGIILAHATIFGHEPEFIEPRRSTFREAVKLASRPTDEQFGLPVRDDG